MNHVILKVVYCFTAAIVIAFGVGACVSVNLGAKPGQRSNAVQLKAPTAPFEEMSKTPADAAWQNRSNGNTISYYSTCNDSTDPAVESVMHELFVEVKDVRTIRTGNMTYNAREALQTEVEGQLDGVKTRIRALIFKKNGCTYTLTHIGVLNAFEADRARFDAFLANFRVP